MKKLKTILKVVIGLAVIGCLVWFLILWPYISFKTNEQKLLEAGKRSYEINSDKLPSGTQVATISMQVLYNQQYIKEDIFIPYTKSPCSNTESWVKVRNEGKEYKYYAYLKCGSIQSDTDHEGPEIKLNEGEEIIANKGEKFEDPGVKSVIDNTDGKIDLEKVSIKSNVDTKNTGEYEITYTALDSMKNKTVVTRKVKVVERLTNMVRQATDTAGYYQGLNPNNYIMFSGMLFRIVDISGENVRIVANEDVANVNYSGIEKWLDEYYYKHIAESSKEYIAHVAESPDESSHSKVYVSVKSFILNGP